MAGCRTQRAKVVALAVVLVLGAHRVRCHVYGVALRPRLGPVTRLDDEILHVLGCPRECVLAVLEEGDRQLLALLQDHVELEFWLFILLQVDHG